MSSKTSDPNVKESAARTREGFELRQGEITGWGPAGEIVVRFGPRRSDTARCEPMNGRHGTRGEFGIGDHVLVALNEGDVRPGVILGTLRRSPGEAPTSSDELVIEARKSLTIRVGESSITLRADGKILIQGKDLVSYAKRMNRIKGGAVSIN